MEKQRRRGRPPTFSREDREYLAGLIREHGITGARRAARFTVCQRTLIGIARDFGIELRKGRRPRLTADAGREWPGDRLWGVIRGSTQC